VILFSEEPGGIRGHLVMLLVVNLVQPMKREVEKRA